MKGIYLGAPFPSMLVILAEQYEKQTFTIIDQYFLESVILFYDERKINLCK